MEQAVKINVMVRPEGITYHIANAVGSQKKTSKSRVVFTTAYNAEAVAEAVTRAVEGALVTLEKTHAVFLGGRKLSVEQMPKAQQFIALVTRGVDYGRPFVVQWISDNERFMLITRPGHQTWAGRGSRRYAEIEHWLIDLSKMTPEHVHEKNRSIRGNLMDQCTVEHCRGKALRSIILLWKYKAAAIELASAHLDFQPKTQ